ncbi:MAG: primosomal protein N' (replication factor Y) - superfamily II helicase [Paracoccaceae bacterium]
MSEHEAEHRFPCAECGSDLRYNPGCACLKCDHCGAEAALTPLLSLAEAREELSYDAAISAKIPASEIEVTRVVKCESCGAQVELGDDDHAAECPFCASPVVVGTGTHRHLKPRAVLPFHVAEDTARDGVGTWLGKLWFAPNGLKTYARKGRRLQGIYVPYWTYDSETDSRYTGERGDHYYVNVTVNGKTKRQRRTRWSRRSGEVSRNFDDVLVLASQSLPKNYTDSLTPWNLAALEPYAPCYLAGYRAEAYSVDLEQGFGEARDIMDAIIRGDVRRDIGGDVQRIHTLDTTHRNVTFKHILLPIWLAAYKYRGKTYRLVVNGLTGKVQGERPYSAWKIAFAVVLGLIVAGGLAYFFSQNQ